MPGHPDMPILDPVPADAHAASLLTAALGWMDGLWDEPQALLRNPDHGNGVPGDQRTRHLLRESAWYALGLWLRRAPGDIERAERALERVLEHQYHAPGAAFDGSFARSPEEPHPPPTAVIWRDYDPNWRQFVGSALALVLSVGGGALSGELAARLERAILRAVAGEPAGRITASYSNIALLQAWLLCWVGRRRGDDARLRQGERLADEIAQQFRRYGAFAEYNAPTYYGIDLLGLALWRSVAVSPLLRDLGHELEAALWRDLAQFYHPDLRNLCGPFDRSYGMDMTRYAATLSLWLWAGLGRAHAPLELGRPLTHAADICLAPCVALLGSRIPAEARAQLLAFAGPRGLRRRLPPAPFAREPQPAERQVSAWLDTAFMLGAQAGARSGMVRGQFCPATVHWRLPGEPPETAGVGWMRLLDEAPVDAVVARNTLTVTPVTPVTPGAPLTLLVYAPQASAAAFTAERWALPGLQVTLASPGWQLRSAVPARPPEAPAGSWRVQVAPSDRGAPALRFVFS